MVTRGMSVEALEQEEAARPPCWEFQAEDAGAAGCTASCEDCVVRYLKALDCFKLMGMRPAAGRRFRDCADCPYFRRYGETPSDPEES